jgi:perosamine synthetase
MEPLAVLGGQPELDEQMFTIEHALGEEELDAVRRVVESRGLSAYGNVAEVFDFEDTFADFVGTDHAVSVSSGTGALQVALRAIGVEPGDKVVLPAYTFVAVPQAVLAVNAVPRFVDIESDTWCLDPAAVDDAIDDEVSAVVGVDQYGLPADRRRLAEICADNDVYFVEDCAQACGATFDGQRVGSFGDVGCFSFQESKNMTTLGEGGMITTDDDEIQRRARVIRNVGFQNEDGSSILEGYDPTRPEDAENLGFNFRMTAVQAAVGKVQLEKLPDHNETRRQIAGYYDERIAELEFVGHQARRDAATHVYDYYIATVDELPRPGFVSAVQAENLQASPYQERSLPEYTMFQERSAYDGTGYPFVLAETSESYDPDGHETAVDHARRNFELPMHPGVDRNDVDRVIDVLEKVERRMGDSI